MWLANDTQSVRFARSAPSDENLVSANCKLLMDSGDVYMTFGQLARGESLGIAGKIDVPHGSSPFVVSASAKRNDS